jgi:hypothetical protein
MKVATTCTPPPSPSGQQEHQPVRRAESDQPGAESVDQQGAGEDIEEVDEGAADVDGEQEHQVHREQEDGDTQRAVEHDPVDPVRDAAPDPVLASHRRRGDLVDEAVAGVGDIDVDVVTEHLGCLGAQRIQLGRGNVFGHLFGKIVALEQAERQPMWVDLLFRRLRRDLRHQFGDRRFDRGCIPDGRGGRSGVACARENGRAQLGDALAGRGDHRDHGAAETFGQARDVDRQSALARGVHHVQRDQRRHAHLDQLCGQVEIALQVGGVDDVDDEVGLACGDVIARDLLVQRDLAGGDIERVGARQVDQFELDALEDVAPGLALDGDARASCRPAAWSRSGC